MKASPFVLSYALHLVAHARLAELPGHNLGQELDRLSGDVERAGSAVFEVLHANDDLETPKSDSLREWAAGARRARSFPVDEIEARLDRLLQAYIVAYGYCAALAIAHDNDTGISCETGELPTLGGVEAAA